MARRKDAIDICTVEGCGGKHHGKGLCRKHYCKTPYILNSNCERRKKWYFKNHARELAKASAMRADNRMEIREYMKQWRKPYAKELTLKARNNNLLTKYGITLGQKKERIQAQGNRCANPNCRSESSGARDFRDLSTDHDHVTGKLRGELCSNCNLALGHVKDDPYRLKGLIEYLENYGTFDYGATFSMAGWPISALTTARDAVSSSHTK